MERMNYKGLSKKFGLTTQKIKTLLANAGHLSGNAPTSSAVTDGVVEVIMVEDKFNGRGLVPSLLWNVSEVERVLQVSGLLENAEVRVETFIRSGHDAMRRVEEAGEILEQIIPKQTRSQEIDSVIMDLQMESIEIAHDVVGGRNGRAVRAWVEPKMRIIVDALQTHGTIDCPDAKRALSKLEAVIAWAEK